MADQNEIEFKVRVTDDGLPALERNLQGVDRGVAALEETASKTGDALGEIGRQKQAVETIRELGTQGRELGQRLNASVAEVERLATALPAAAAASQDLERAQQSAKNELEQTRAQIKAMQQALNEQRASTDKAARGTDDYKASVAQARSTINELKQQLVSKGEALRTAADAASKAATEERKLQREYDAAVSVTGKVSAAVGSNRRAMDAARESAQRLGVDVSKLASEKARLDAAAKRVGDQVRRVGAAYTEAGTAATQAGQKMSASTDGVSGRLSGLSQQLATLRNVASVALGGTLVGSLAKDLAEVADGYDNLSGRIKLATGEGQAFESAMADVTSVALDTNSNLDATGTLFARLTEAGRSAGQSAQDAQADALGLTQTINEAIQVSGASSQAAQAAVTQLIQGLNAGVLRGEEFNSVVEQSPRLAKAMADGLGVTIGELRNMANAGQLTATVVREALQGQAQAVRSEFEQLPPTVGRAIENLNTAWTVYVGEVNQATGASKTAAAAIKALADNLDTVVGLLIDAGQAAAAFAALRLAQQFLGIGAAAKTSAVAIAANTAALTASSAAGAANATALAGATVSGGRFAAMLGGLKTTALLAILTNIQDIGVAIGEGAAKLAGYQDKSEELARTERERAKAAQEGRNIALAQEAANKAARDAQFELSKAATEGIAKFEELRLTGQTAAEAISTIGKDFDLESLPGIQNAAGVLDKLAADGKLSADQVRQAWADALKGEDLQAFEVNARAALSGTAREGERLAAIMDATLREAIRRSGADFDVLAGGMTKATRSAINDTDTIIAGLDKLKEQGVDVGQALEASISKGIKTVDSQAGVEALRTRIEALRSKLGEKVADGLLAQLREQAEQAGLALDKLPEKAQSVAERTAQAFKNMGIQTEAELQKAAESASRDYELIKASGQATADGLAQAWRRMAEASIAANGGVASETLQAEAAMHGLEIATDQAGRAIVKNMEQGSKAVEGFARGVQQAQEQLKRLKELQGFARAGGDLSEVSTEDLKKAQSDLLKEGGALSSTEYIRMRNELMSRQGANTDKDGFSVDSSGNRLAMGGELTTLTGIKNFLQQAGLDEEQAKRVAREFSDGKGGIPYIDNPGQRKYGGDFSTISEALLKAAERTTFGMGGSGGAPVGRTVTVRLDGGKGRREEVKTDEAGADALIRALESAQRRS